MWFFSGIIKDASLWQNQEFGASQNGTNHLWLRIPPAVLTSPTTEQSVRLRFWMSLEWNFRPYMYIGYRLNDNPFNVSILPFSQFLYPSTTNVHQHLVQPSSATKLPVSVNNAQAFSFLHTLIEGARPTLYLIFNVAYGCFLSAALVRSLHYCAWILHRNADDDAHSIILLQLCRIRWLMPGFYRLSQRICP